jgi:predicted deacylase
METYAVGTAVAARGERAFGTIPVPGLDVALPVAVLHGRRPGPTVCVTAGIHGAEYVGIEAAIRIIHTLDPQRLRGTVVVVPVTNPPAFAARAIYVCPLDGRNLNRVFPGAPEGTASERIAHAVFTAAIARADAYIDLHGGDLNEALLPFTLYHGRAAPEVVARARAMADAFGIRHVVDGVVEGAAYAAAAVAGIPAILPEAGGQGVLDPAMVRVHTRGVVNVLRHLGVLRGRPARGRPPVRVVAFPWIRSAHAGLFYPRVRVGDRVEAGALVGELRDWFGRPLTEVTSPASGVVLFVVTAPATNPGDPLLAVGVTEG